MITARLARLNAQAKPAAEAEFFACCGSRRWAREMTAHRPFRDLAHLCEVADQVWASLDHADWLEAFRAHPKIGERASQGAETARRWAAQEQSAARAVSQDVAARLAAQNLAYEKKFGYIFLVDATGKSSDEMLAILERAHPECSRARDSGSGGTAAPHHSPPFGKAAVGDAMTGITTHVLDTSRGKPAAGISVVLERRQGGDWQRVNGAVTGADGRTPDLLPPTATIAPGTFRLLFDTGAYFRAQGLAGFYPEVSVSFEIQNPTEHHHIPLLLSPFGYSTYRGS